jgi:hypothetical protein
MTVKQLRRHVPVRRGAGPAYFVGRRRDEAAEVYAVSAKEVRRLWSARRYGESNLDWHGSTAARMELSHLLIARIAEQLPSRELQSRFVLYVLSNLPDDGFVLHADEIRRWLLAASDEQDFLPADRAPWSWAGRLRSLLPGSRLSARMPDPRPVSTSAQGGTAGARRPAERHYLAVLAAETRRLARQLRPPSPSHAGTRAQTRGEGRAQALP